MKQDPSISEMTAEEAHILLSLRLLIARAANADSLAWWDDESLTPHAGFLLERLFSRSPALAARSLALRAASARYQAALAHHDGALHLYQLDADNRDGLALRSQSPLPIPVPEGPIATIDALRRHLLHLVGEAQPYTVLRRTDGRGLQIEIPPRPSGLSPFVHRARTLAWACLEGRRGEPVYPFCLEPST